ncbi:hypothetical protein C8F01DRAFT_736409 [Mycena amicta]|nr:hypothetical protein C8F01DRAFT_736409 [Mycena amicta]
MLLRMFQHSPPHEYTVSDSGKISPHSRRPSSTIAVPLGRRMLTAIAFGALGCALGFGLATTWTREPNTVGCVAHFDMPRPLFDLEAAPAVITLTTTVQAPLPTRSLGVNQKPLLNGSPTAAFKDNLRPEVAYITTWPGSGWTNDVLLYMNLLYLALITERVAVIPYFTPTHVGGGAPTIAFGEIFDIPRLEQELRIRILEWHQVKDPASEVVDSFGCWSVWKGVQSFNNEPHFTSATMRLKLDVSYTAAPRWIKLEPGNDGDPHAAFWALASLAFQETRAENLQTPALSPIHQLALPPDEHMLCYDYLYYVGASNTYEWEADYSPAWRFVGRHMHWAPDLVKISERYIRHALVVAPYEPTPPYISVHVRHGDFGGWCELPLTECFAPLSVIARRVEEVQDEIWEKKRVVVDRVIVTSDEQDARWWDEVTELGWVRPDHSQTAALYGAWHPILIDAVIQSSAMGFVGTDKSTVSIMARKRVEAWNNGTVRTVRWGSPGADDH